MRYDIEAKKQKVQDRVDKIMLEKVKPLTDKIALYDKILGAIYEYEQAETQSPDV